MFHGCLRFSPFRVNGAYILHSESGVRLEVRSFSNRTRGPAGMPFSGHICDYHPSLTEEYYYRAAIEQDLRIYLRVITQFCPVT